jgi:hypothetical protein
VFTEMVAHVSHALALDVQFAVVFCVTANGPSEVGIFAADTTAGELTVPPGATSGMQLVKVVCVLTPQCTVHGLPACPAFVTVTVNVFG